MRENLATQNENQLHVDDGNNTSIHEIIDETSKQQQIFQAIAKHFNSDELKTLCFSLEIDFDELGGEGKSGKIRELILYCIRNELVEKLVIQCSQLRPKSFWPRNT